eukprot:3947526-Prorocentrum_lima.AAC.1
MLAEQNLQAKMLIEAISARVRDQQRAQQARSKRAVEIMEESNAFLKSRMEDMILETGRSTDREHQKA